MLGIPKWIQEEQLVRVSPQGGRLGAPPKRYIENQMREKPGENFKFNAPSEPESALSRTCLSRLVPQTGPPVATQTHRLPNGSPRTPQSLGARWYFQEKYMNKIIVIPCEDPCIDANEMARLLGRAPSLIRR